MSPKKIIKAKSSAKSKVAPKKVAKKPAKPVVKKTTSVDNIYSKSKIIQHIADVTTLTKKDINKCFDSLFGLMEMHLKKRGPGQFIFPGVAKFRVIHKPATKAREGVNPFTGAPTVFAAKPARSIVKVKPLKKIKDIVE
jgi:nucleoid DNA-binding protein